MNMALETDLAVFNPSKPKIENRRERLRDIIRDQSLLTGDFTLSSGRSSTYLFQLRQTTMHPEGSSLIGRMITEFMVSKNIGCVGGLELGAVPVVSSVSVMSHEMGNPVKAFFVRKKPKSHGAGEQIDGHIVDDGSDILVVDDVATTGGSILKTVEILKRSNCSVSTALVVVDREEGAKEKLAEHNIELHSLFTKSDFDI